MIYYEEPSATIYQGHALDVLEGMSPESVDCVITSPPYWGLRTYKTKPIIWGDNNCEHEWGKELIVNKGTLGNNLDTLVGSQTAGIAKAANHQGQFCLKCNAWRGELGLEPTIELYICHLLQIFDEVKRVLKKTGTCWVNIGDSYNSAASNQSGNLGNAAALAEIGHRTPLNKALPPKSLCLIPERFVLGMVERGWILRNNIIWYKANPMPESVKDRFTGTYEYLYFFVKNKRYWFEQQFEPVLDSSLKRAEYGLHNTPEGQWAVNVQIDKMGERFVYPLGRNKRDVWEINTVPCLVPGVHFATFPEKLVETPILAGCPSAICKKCGKAREKIYEVVGHQVTEAMRVAGSTEQGEYTGQDLADYESGLAQSPSDSRRRILESMSEIKEFTYTDCGCNAGFEAGGVLDPFAGSGATGAVAKRFARRYIGIELSAKYCKLHKKRLQGIPLPMELV